MFNTSEQEREYLLAKGDSARFQCLDGEVVDVIFFYGRNGMKFLVCMLL